MKILRKLNVLWIMTVLLLFGGRVQATEVQNVNNQAADIIAKSTQAMNNVKTMGIETFLDNQKIIGMYMDMNTGIISISMFIGESESVVWVDQRANMSYIYDSNTNEYYFEPINGEQWQAENGTSVEYDASLSYSYMGEEAYAGKECYKVLAAQSGVPITYTYYIEKTSYLVTAVIMEMGGEKYVQNYSYPESVTIPEEAKREATLIEGYQFIKNKLVYQIKYVKGKPVLYVVSSSKDAKGTIKIPDTVKICGKDYKVYGIEENAFSENRKITSVTLGKNITTIGKKAFYRCKKLKLVKMNATGLTQIGSKAFYGNAGTLKFKVPKKKLLKYEKMLKKSQISSKWTISEI